jgi:uncharacterized membrane protein YphA (DoxX/SURF4 family)
VYSGWAKVQDPSAFLGAVRSFDLLGDPFAAWVALFLPWMEIFAGLAVVTGILRHGGLLLLNLSLVVFLAGICVSWARGLDIRCGCFGDPNQLTSTAAAYTELIIRDLVLLALGGFLQWRARKDKPSPVS